MKTKFYWFALFASAALIAQAQAGGHHGGGGSGGGFDAVGRGPGRSGAGPSFHSMSARGFSGGRTFYSGQRFSSAGTRSPSLAYRQAYANPYRGTPMSTRRFAASNINRGNGATRLANGRIGTNRVRNGNNLRSDWRSHVFAQHSANWNRNWDRSRDHWWHGHRCHFVNGSWLIFDLGFYPWWSDWYPYDYYAYGYPYPSGYDSDYYDSGTYQDQDDQNSYGDQSDNSMVASAQERLAREGYYRGEIDGIAGQATSRAIARYQRSHGLRVTGNLTTDTLEALRLRQFANE